MIGLMGFIRRAPQRERIEVPARPHFAVVEAAGRCEKCLHEEVHWTIKRPDGSLIDRAWPDEDTALYVCDLMNEAFETAQEGN
jgi:hypothetical protein